MKNFLLALAMTFAVAGHSPLAAQTLKAYGPGGPAPAMKEAAQAFEKKSGIKVEITAGPTPQWKDKATADPLQIPPGDGTASADLLPARQLETFINSDQ